MYLPDPAARFTVSSLDVACAVEMYWGDQPFPGVDPHALGACEHLTEIRFPPTDVVVPIVAFSRTGGEIVVVLTPTGDP